MGGKGQGDVVEVEAPVGGLALPHPQRREIMDNLRGTGAPVPRFDRRDLP